jgi:hypothetical protein
MDGNASDNEKGAEAKRVPMADKIRRNIKVIYSS